MRIFDSFLSVFAPHDCVGCRSEGALLCATCQRTMAHAISRCYKCHTATIGYATCSSCRRVSALCSVMAAVKYEAVAKDIVWKLKFGRAWGAADEIAGMVERSLRIGRLLEGRRGIIITHAPTANSRVRRRGYDQAALIARSLARNSNVRYCRLLARLGHQEQIGASKAQRASQMAEAFMVIHRSNIQGAHIILVDDVVTTGATLEAAAKTLTDAGARRVDAIVFAQA